MTAIKQVDRQWLKDLRKAKRMKVREVAETLGISYGFYSEVENGWKNPSIEKAYIIADFFEVDVQLFFTNRVRFSEKVH